MRGGSVSPGVTGEGGEEQELNRSVTLVAVRWSIASPALYLFLDFG